jgi:hypothetical protein
LLKFVVEAEKCGFTTTMTIDHFHGGTIMLFGNFTWVWIAASAERTKKMQFVTGVTAPIYRYHPGIIAQAFASLDVLYPGRDYYPCKNGSYSYVFLPKNVPFGFVRKIPLVPYLTIENCAPIVSIFSKLEKQNGVYWFIGVRLAYGRSPYFGKLYRNDWTL